jgi:hypothetical protein
LFERNRGRVRGRGGRRIRQIGHEVVRILRARQVRGRKPRNGQLTGREQFREDEIVSIIGSAVGEIAGTEDRGGRRIGTAGPRRYRLDESTRAEVIGGQVLAKGDLTDWTRSKRARAFGRRRDRGPFSGPP